jgi:CheY-like chemotaxis protein
VSEWTALLVDDEVEFITSLAERLSLRGISVDFASDGHRALELIEKQRPRVVVLDLLMPGIGGIEILQRIRASYPEVQVIVTTGTGESALLERSRELGSFAELAKPIQIDSLVSTMQAAARRAQEVAAGENGE